MQTESQNEDLIVNNEVYELVKWPEVQELMDYDWFTKECFLYNAIEDQEQLSSAYFVPIRRIMEIDESC